jgi:hypothetical protein
VEVAGPTSLEGNRANAPAVIRGLVDLGLIRPNGSDA